MSHGTLEFDDAKRPWRVVATGVLIIALLALTSIRSFYDRTAADIFFSITLASMIIIFLHVRPWWEALQVAVASALLVLLQAAVLKVPLRIIPALALLGTGSLGLLAYRRIWSTEEQRERLHYAFLPPLLFVLLGYAGSAPLEITNRFHPKTLDLFLYNFDCSMGVQLSFKMGQLVLRSRWLTRIALLFYFALPIPVMLVFAKQLVRSGSAVMSVFLGFFMAGPAAVIFYNLFPACGPIYLFPSRFPFAPLSLEQMKETLIQPVLVSGMRNAFPSLHLAWALLAWWYGQGLSQSTKLFLLLFFAGTVIATLGLGEHYFVDLVAAFPFALMIHSGCAVHVPWLDRRRLMPFLYGALLLFGWIVLLRFGLRIAWTSLFVPWTLIGGTIVSCFALDAGMQNLLPNRFARIEA
jgi:PAP2 superfamily